MARDATLPNGGGSPTGSFRGSHRALLDEVSDMVTVSDRAGRIVYANPATEKVTGWTPEEFAATHPFETIHPEDRLRCEETFERLLGEPGLSLEIEHRFRHKDGSWRWSEGTFRNLFEDPEVGGLVATLRDVSRRKRVQQVLREDEERQAFLLRLSDPLRPLADAAEIQGEAARVLGEHLMVPRVAYGLVEGDEIVVRRDYARGVPSMIGRYPMTSFGRQGVET